MLCVTWRVFILLLFGQTLPKRLDDPSLFMREGPALRLSEGQVSAESRSWLPVTTPRQLGCCGVDDGGAPGALSPGAAGSWWG